MSEHHFEVTQWKTTGTRAPTDASMWALADLLIEVKFTENAIKADLPLVKLAIYGTTPNDKGSLRWAGNIVSITGVEAEHDEGTMSLAEAAAKLQAADIEALLYTTFSHTAAAPRWRIFAPVSEPMPLARRAALVARLNGVLGGVLADESFVDGQCYYIGHKQGATDAEHTLTKGRFIDLCHDLDAAAIGKPKPTPREARIAAYANNPSTEGALQALALGVEEIASVAGTNMKYKTVRRVTWNLAKLVNGGFLDQEDAQTAIYEAADDAGADDMEPVHALWESAIARQDGAEVNDGSELGSLPPLVLGEEYSGPLELTEEATARAFARENADKLRFDHSEKAWYHFDPTEGWTTDTTSHGLNTARKYVSELCLNPAFSVPDIKSAKHIRFARAIFDAGMSDPLMAMTAADWNSDPMILGVPGGYVDLTTGEMHLARAPDLIRRRTAVVPARHGTPAPMWMRFLDQATGSDNEMQAYIMRLFGYWLTADMREEKISFFYGSGGNGKGVLVSTVSQIMGDYAYQAPAELFKADSRTNREYQLAMLMGRRLLIASETENKSALAESFVKELSGNEGKINARHPYGRPFEFRSVAKLLLVGNHAPQLQGRTQAMERRLQVAPFNCVPASPDHDLKEKLRAEWPAILRLAIDGALSWRQRGLGSCRAIESASRAYFAEQDALAQWIEQRCDVGLDKQVQSSEALASFNDFARSRNEPPLDARSFKEAMLRKPGFTSAHVMVGKVFRGLSLRVLARTSLGELSD